VEDERLRRENERLREENERLHRKIREISKENRDLKKQLAKALHKEAALEAATPSSRKLFKPAKAPGPRRPRGAQPGHDPHIRRDPETPDATVEVTLDRCPGCGGPLGEPCGLQTQRTVDIVTPQPVHTEVRYHRYWCPTCKRKVRGSTPVALPGRRFGPRLTAMIVVLRMTNQPLRAIQQTLETLAGVHLSVGEINDLEQEVARALGPRYEAIVRDVRLAALVHADETGFPVDGKPGWLWVFVSQVAAYYTVGRRSKEIPRRVLGEDFAGILVCDGWRSYRVVGGRRQRCWVHIIRHLQAVEAAHGMEARGPLDPSPPTYKRAGRPPARFLAFDDALRAVFREAVAYSERAPAKATWGRRKKARAFERRVRRLCDLESGDADVRRISKELLDHMDELFTFVELPGVPWHNNAAESAVRAGVLARKVSGGRRSEAGARAYSVLMSVKETSRRRCEDWMAVVTQALAGSGPPRASTKCLAQAWTGTPVKVSFAPSFPSSCAFSTRNFVNRANAIEMTTSRTMIITMPIGVRSAGVKTAIMRISIMIITPAMVTKMSINSVSRILSQNVLP
jgi:transposase